MLFAVGVLCRLLGCFVCCGYFGFCLGLVCVCFGFLFCFNVVLI